MSSNRKTYKTSSITYDSLSVASARPINEKIWAKKLTITGMKFLDSFEKETFTYVLDRISYLCDICTFFIDFKNISEFSITLGAIGKYSKVFSETNDKEVTETLIKVVRLDSYEHIMIIRNRSLFSQRAVNTFIAVRKRNNKHKYVLPLHKECIYISENMLILSEGIWGVQFPKWFNRLITHYQRRNETWVLP